MRFTKTMLATTILAASIPAMAAVGTTSDTTTKVAANKVTVSPEEKAKIEQVIQEYLKAKPEVIVEAIQVLQRKQYEDAEKTIKNTQKNVSKYVKNLFHAKGDPVGGNPKGAVTVVEFFDYQCPHCVDMGPVISKIIKANPNVRVIFKEFPIRGEMSDFAARAALAANLQGKYYELHDAILQIKPPITKDAIYNRAKDLGLNVDKLKKDMDSDKIKDQIKANVNLAQELKLFGTPAFFIGSTDAANSGDVKYVPGAMSQPQMQEAIKKALKS